MAFHLKLTQPKELPADGVTTAEFRPWRNHLINFLQQDVDNFRFLKGGKYSEWKPACDVVGNWRIERLLAGDEDKEAIEAVLEAAAIKTAKKTRLLNTRNAQLGKMLQHIVTFVHYTEADDIDQHSTSVDWIFNYLQNHYNIQAKGSNFLKITDHTFKSGTLPQVFYKQFRTSFLNNLRKEGEVMTHKGGQALTEDEVLSPSFEDTIVLWALEKIDPRLPKKVRKDYEHRLTGNTYLIDLQVTIFQSIPSMLEDLSRQADLNALTTHSKDLSLSAIRHGGKNFPRGGGGGRGGGQGSGQRNFSNKFCTNCHSAGKPVQIKTSHTVADCGFLTRRDKKDMFTSLRALNLGEAEAEDDDDDTLTVDKDDLDAAEDDQD